jgi:hypothetical protein
MRNIILLAVGALALAACGNRSSVPAAQANAAPGGKSAAEYEAEAAKDEAEANRLLAQANGQPGAAPAAPPGAAGDQPVAGSHKLGPGSEQLHTGQYYQALTFPAEAGKTYLVTYDTQGYRPAIVVLDPNKQMFTQSVAAPHEGQTAYHLEDEIKPDSTGDWHVLLTTADVGATGTFTVNMQAETAHQLN